MAPRSRSSSESLAAVERRAQQCRHERRKQESRHDDEDAEQRRRAASGSSNGSHVASGSAESQCQQDAHDPAGQAQRVRGRRRASGRAGSTGRAVATRAQSIAVIRSLGADDVGIDAERLQATAHPLGIFAVGIGSDADSIARHLPQSRSRSVYGGESRLLQALRKFRAAARSRSPLPARQTFRPSPALELVAPRPCHRAAREHAAPRSSTASRRCFGGRLPSAGSAVAGAWTGGCRASLGAAGLWRGLDAAPHPVGVPTGTLSCAGTGGSARRGENFDLLAGNIDRNVVRDRLRLGIQRHRHDDNDEQRAARRLRPGAAAPVRAVATSGSARAPGRRREAAVREEPDPGGVRGGVLATPESQGHPCSSR